MKIETQLICEMNFIISDSNKNSPSMAATQSHTDSVTLFNSKRSYLASSFVFAKIAKERHLQLTAVGDLALLERLVVGVGARGLDLLDDLHALDHLAEHDVLQQKIKNKNK
jgi:hypothetical protein